MKPPSDFTQCQSYPSEYGLALLASLGVLRVNSMQNPTAKKTVQAIDMSLLALTLTLALQATKPKLQVQVFVLADCPIARQYAPEIQRIQKEYGAKGVGFTLVHVDPHTTDSSAKTYAKEFGYRCPFVLDSNHALAKKAGVTTVPSVAVYENTKLVYLGRIDDRYPTLGALRAPTRRDLRIALDETLAGKPVSKPRTTTVGCLLPTIGKAG